MACRRAVSVRSSRAFARQCLYMWGGGRTSAAAAAAAAAALPRPVALDALLSEADADTPVPIAVAAGAWSRLFAVPSQLQLSLFALPPPVDGDEAAGAAAAAPTQEPELLLRLAPNERLRALSAGRAHAALLVASSAGTRLVTFGDNAYGQLGVARSRVSARSVGEALTAAATAPPRMKDVVCGLDHTLVLTERGEVYAAGWNADGQLGTGDAEARDVFGMVGGLPGAAVKIACRADQTLALLRDGRVFAWGNNEYAQHMIPAKETRVLRPLHLPFAEPVHDVAAGGSFVLVMTKSGRVYSCGFGLGLGQGRDVLESASFQPVLGLPHDVVEIHASLSFGLAVTKMRDVYTWGAGRQGQLGLGTFEDTFEARKVPLPPTVRLAYFSCGVDHVLASGAELDEETARAVPPRDWREILDL